MKGIFVILFLSISLFGYGQVETVCGNDSINLKVNNLQVGAIQWEKSFDNEHWVEIDNAQDETYKFLPTERAFYRAINKFPYCDPNDSPVTLVQIPELVELGEDRVVNGEFTYLFGNPIKDGTVSWSIVSGNGGSFETPDNSSTKFEGTPGSTYIVKYTIQDACGTRSDTKEVRFIENTYYDNLVVVDATDIITSTEEDHAEGIYRITFSDPVPDIDNESILLDASGDGFMRKVISYDQDGDDFTIYTAQAKLEEVLLDGALELGKLIALGDFEEGGQAGKPGGFNQLDALPTRQELKINPDFSAGVFYYVIDEYVESELNGINKLNSNTGQNTTNNFNQNQGTLEELGVGFSFDDTELLNEDGLSVKLDGGLFFYPNAVADIKVNNLPVGLKKILLGVENAHLDFDAKLTIQAAYAYEPDTPYQFNLFTLHKRILMVIGGVPTLIKIKVKFNGELNFNVETEGNFEVEFSNIYSLNAGIIYENGQWNKYFTDKNETSFGTEMDANVSLTGSLDFGPSTYFTVNGIAGPYLDTKMTTDLGLCVASANDEFNWGLDFDIGGKLVVGIHGYLFKKELFNYSKTWENRKLLTERRPYRLIYTSGNHQRYIKEQQIPGRLKIRVLSKTGYPSEGTFVTFRTEEENTGEFTQETAITDADGYAQTLFTPTADESVKVIASVKDCDFNEIQNSTFTFILKEDEEEVFNCENTTLSASFYKNGNTLIPNAHMGVPPYTYSTDFINFSSTKPVINVVADENYKAVVQDDNGCVASTHFYQTDDNCIENDLNIEVSTYGNNAVVEAQGGNPPYLFALDNGDFSSSNTFMNISIESHLFRVKDNSDCISQTRINFTDSTSNLVAYFELPQTVNVNQPVLFNNLSTNATSYSWDFGNGQTSTDENPSTVFTCSGTHLITLTAYNGSVMNTFSREINITDGQPCMAIDDDGYVYDMVTIGNQVWMAENYRYGGILWENNEDYGRYFHNGVGSLPDGWRLPTKDDYQELLDVLGSGAFDFLTSDIEFNAKPYGYITQTLYYNSSGYANDAFNNAAVFLTTDGIITGNWVGKTCLSIDFDTQNIGFPLFTTIQVVYNMPGTFRLFNVRLIRND